MDSEKKEKGLFRIFCSSPSSVKMLIHHHSSSFLQEDVSRDDSFRSLLTSHTGGRNDYQVSSWQLKALCLRDTKNNIPGICPCELTRDILPKGKTQLSIPFSASKGPLSLPCYVSFLFVLFVVKIDAEKW